MRAFERGDSLLEVVVAVAIIAVATGALGAATIAAVHRFGPDPLQSALEATVTREMRIAVDVLKYQGASLPSTNLATTIPLPSGSPFPAHLSLSTTAAANGSVTIVLSASDDNDVTKAATLSQTIAAPAPLPGARLPAAANGAAPQ
ncbi:MAG: prepilin-type N-terminal cleavage/methylation domain-containing protein [Candidatus Aquilonibacter sp.]